MFKSITQNQFDSTVSVEIARVLKRSPNQSIGTVADTLENANVDMSASYVEILSALIDCLTNSELLVNTSRSIGALVKHSASNAAKIEIIGKVSGAFPRFGQQSVDLSGASVLLHICRSLKSGESSVCHALASAGLTSGLLKQLKLTPSEDVKVKIVEAMGSLARLVLASELPICSFVKDDLVSLLADKKSPDRVKEAVLLAIEACIPCDKTGQICSPLIPVDSIVPFLTRLVEGRLTARVSCLAAWMIALHAFVGDKKVSQIFTQCVASDVTLNPVLGEDSVIVRRLLRSVVAGAVHQRDYWLSLFGSEMETITFPSMSEKMKNRFAVNFLKVVGVTSYTNFEFPEIVGEFQFANTLVLALYELITSRAIPGYMARVSLEVVAKLARKMDTDSLALLVVLAHHPFFASKRISIDQVWKKFVSPKLLLPSAEKVRGIIFQGAQLPVHDVSGFRVACLATCKTLASEGLLNPITKEALSRINGSAIASVASFELGIHFCPENVVWTETDDWIPRESNTLLCAPKEQPPQVGKGKGGATKEDMMRMSLREQESVRSRIAALANSTRFFLDVVSMRCGDEFIGSEISRRMDEMMVLLESPLTSESAKSAIHHALSVSFTDAEANVVSRLLVAVAIGDPMSISVEDWVDFFDSEDSVSGTMTSVQFNLILPLFRSALTGTIVPEIATSAIEALSRQSELPLLPVLELIDSVSKISAGPFASSIGKVLRLRAPDVRVGGQEATLFCAIGITDNEKLFSEFLSAVVLLEKSVILSDFRVQAFLVTGCCEEFHFVTLPILPNESLTEFSPKVVSELMIMLKTESPLIQKFSAQALAYICRSPAATLASLTQVLEACETNQLGLGFALALGQITKVPLGNDFAFLSSFLRFVVGSAMTDPALTVPVRDQLLIAVQEAVSTHGENHALQLLAVTEEFIGLKQEAAAFCVPVILGLLTKHLPPTDERVSSVRTKLVAELLTAAQPEVQIRIASVLPPLLKMSDDVPKYLETFLNTALTSTDPKARYGGALGVGAAAKAQGVGILRQMEVLKKLQEVLEAKHQSHESRQGAISVYGGLSLALGRLFEPYVGQVLPVLLVAFGDGNVGVREASNLAASQIMSSLSTHGIKLVLPSLLKGVEDLQWRTKLGSIKLLSAMLNCAPKQLATCLPKVVPALSEAATDTHSKVKEAACASLTEVVKVIGNPEIKACAHKLVASLTDPANDGLRQEALDVLLSTSFVHSLDAASLALVIPVMLRATRERRSEVKRKGAQILGSIAVLSADPTEGLGPYMDRIIPSLQDVLVDPIPDVRTTAAKALGTMARAVPEMIIAQVLPWLFSTLKGAESQVERSGAAQGLSEVLVELGPQEFSKILPEVVANAVSPNTNPEAREGYMGLFVFLPSVMRAVFVPYIETVFPVLIQGLSDPLQAVREVALRAASALCMQFAASNATMLMPSLEKGLFAKDWRARQASVQLTGITLESLMKSARGNKDNLLESQVPLTQERRSYMLGMLYIVRSDSNQTVNQNAQAVWKNVVSNTPRTVRLILPILVRLIISNLSSDETRQIISGRCLNDLVGKLADRVLPDLMPILIENIHSNEASVRTGVCIGLSEVVTAAPRQLLQEYFSIMFPAVRDALCDESPLVRSKAGETIAVIYRELGNTAINNTFPQILEKLNSSTEQNDDAAANGVEQLLIALHKDLLSPVVDALTVMPPIGNRVKALEKIAVVPQLEVAKFASRIVAFLMTSFSDLPEESLHAANALFGSFNRHSCHLAMIELLRGLGDSSDSFGKLREASASLIGALVRFAPLEVLAEYMSGLLPLLIRSSLSDTYQPAMEAAVAAFAELVNKVTKEVMIKYMHEIVTAVKDLVSASGTLGLALPKTFESLWPMYQQALMFGNPDIREAAAKGLVVLLESTPTDRLKANAIKVTGTLIRVLGERYPSNVRIALLRSLQVLLQRLESSAMKPFLPQLQTTYQKCTQDQDEAVKALAEESQVLLAKVTAATGGK